MGIQRQVDSGIVEFDDYTNIIPNFYTRTLARELIKQLEGNLDKGLIEGQEGDTLKKPLMDVVDFMKSDLSSRAEQQKDFVSQITRAEKGDNIEEDTSDEEKLEYSAAISTHRA